MAKKAAQSQFHRSQIGRAQTFIRRHFSEPVTLGKIAREAGSSSYHFARLFLAYTGETPFSFLRRVRLRASLEMLRRDPDQSVTAIALDAGYETASAFNKAFKKVLAISPGDFRKIGQEQQNRVIYDLTKPKLLKEITVNLTPTFDFVTRPSTHFVYLERRGPFAEVAPPAWSEMFPILHSQISQNRVTGYLGLSTIDATKNGDEGMIYQAGVSLASAPEPAIKGLQYKEIRDGKYARFVLTGPYSQIWMAFDRMFKQLAEGQVALRPDYCVENYLNDPTVTPEDQLLTELLVPAA